MLVGKELEKDMSEEFKDTGESEGDYSDLFPIFKNDLQDEKEVGEKRVGVTSAWPRPPMTS